jgi:hypothetical protein
LSVVKLQQSAWFNGTTAIMTSESSAASLWRFGVNTDQVQSRSTLEDDWEVTPELLSAFRQLAEVVCPILSRK